MRVLKLILHYNTPELTGRLCQMAPDAIVVDNGSDSDKHPLATGNEIIRFTENLGFTCNWNRVIRLMMDEISQQNIAFWLMNSDIEIDTRSIERVEKLMGQGGIPMLTPSYNCWMWQCRNQGTGSVREVKCIEFTAPVIHRDVFERVGYFDERFIRGYGCEFDFALRLRKMGIKMYCDDGSEFNHIGQQTIKKHTTIQQYENLAVEELQTTMSSLYGPRWKAMITKELDVYKPLPKTKTKKKNMKIAVYTTIFGGYSRLMEPEYQKLSADFFCITDDIMKIDIEEKIGASAWKMIQVDYPRKDLAPRLRAKFFKLFPWECPELRSYDIVIFVDGSIEIINGDFVQHCIDYLSGSDMLLYRHPVRNCIYKEVDASRPLVKYSSENLDLQAATYMAIGHPENAGLYACGIMVRRMTSNVRGLMASWWWEIIKYTYQDQISFPVVCRLHRFTPAVFPENQSKNEFFKIHWHDDKPVTKNGTPGKVVKHKKEKAG